MMAFFNKSIVLSLATAVSIMAAVPNSGDILREVAPKGGNPFEEKIIPTIPLREYKAPLIVKDDRKIMVQGFKLSGNTVFETEQLLDLIQSYKNKELSIGDLKVIASIITKYYRDNGYFVARAYIPVQELSQGIIEIAIIEGLYGNFDMKNTSLVDTQHVQLFMNKLQGGDIVSTTSLERQMLLINDLSGAKVTNAEVLPGQAVGTSDFRVTVEPTRQYTGYATADNYGSKYTGRNRLMVLGTLNSLTQRGDSLTLSLTESLTTNLKNLRTSYETPLGYNGLKGDFTGSVTSYKLGSEYEATNIYGLAKVVGGGLSYPLVKTRHYTLNTTLHLDRKIMEDSSSLNTPAMTARKIVDVITIGLNEMRKTTFFDKPGTLSSTIGVSIGRSDMRNATALNNDLSTRSDGSFAKVTGSLAHTQLLAQEFYVVSSWRGQMSSFSNLDSSEKFSIGGAYGVRGYTDSELSGDKGYQISIEPTYTLPSFDQIYHKVSCFYDAGKVWKNQNKWEGLTHNERTLQAIGVGYQATYNDIALKATIARGMGVDANPASESNAPSNKLFIQLIKGF